MTTFFVLATLWSLWSSSAISDWLWALGAATNVDWKGIVLLPGAFLVVLVLSGFEWRAPTESSQTWPRILLSPAVKSAIQLIILLIIAQPVLYRLLPEPISHTLWSLTTGNMNALDERRQAIGYYEKLNVHQAPNAPPMAIFVRNFNDCSAERWRIRPDYLLHDFTPSLHLQQKCFAAGQTFSTNTWGMRDKEYSLEKPQGTLRFELFGPSHVAGWGVSDGETFEQLVEDRLNKTFSCPKYNRFEILNFSVDSYSLLQQLGLLEERGFRFSPDIVMLSVYSYPSLKALSARNLIGIAKGHMTVPYREVQALLAGAGLENIDNGSVSIPFQSWRTIAKRLGLKPGMPDGELNARADRITDRVNEWVFPRFAEITTSHGATPIVLATNGPSDSISPTVEYESEIRKAGIRVINLYSAYSGLRVSDLQVSGFDDHPNAAGHRVLADKLYPELFSVIKRKCQE